MGAVSGAAVRVLAAFALLASAYWVMYGSGGVPWVVSTGLHIYAVAGIGVAALLLYQAWSRLVRAARN